MSLKELSWISMWWKNRNFNNILFSSSLKIPNCIDFQTRYCYFFCLCQNSSCSFSWHTCTAHDEDGSWEQRTHLISLLAVKIFIASLEKVWSTWKTLKDLTFKPGSSENKRFLEETRGQELLSQNRRVGTYGLVEFPTNGNS